MEQPENNGSTLPETLGDLAMRRMAFTDAAGFPPSARACGLHPVDGKGLNGRCRPMSRP